MLFLAQEIARSLRVATLCGVGTGIHVYGSSRRKIPTPNRNIHFDYDGFWLEARGELREDGWFLLPSKTVRRGLDEVKPNKKSMYAKRYPKRYRMLDEMSRQIRTVMTPFPRG